MFTFCVSSTGWHRCCHTAVCSMPLLVAICYIYRCCCSCGALLPMVPYGLPSAAPPQRSRGYLPFSIAGDNSEEHSGRGRRVAAKQNRSNPPSGRVLPFCVSAQLIHRTSVKRLSCTPYTMKLDLCADLWRWLMNKDLEADSKRARHFCPSVVIFKNIIAAVQHLPPPLSRPLMFLDSLDVHACCKSHRLRKGLLQDTP